MNNDIVIFKNGELELEVSVSEDKETVWLSLDQMAELFKRDRSVIGKHVRNIFKEGELQKESVWAKFAYTAADGKVYDVLLIRKDWKLWIEQLRYNQGLSHQLWSWMKKRC